MQDLHERIALVISTKGMTNAEFAESIEVQPSNISHIMSGRNKPSLDLVMKILKRFPELRTEWLIHGKGAMNKDYGLFDEITPAIENTTQETDAGIKKANIPSTAEKRVIIEKPVQSAGKTMTESDAMLDPKETTKSFTKKEENIQRDYAGKRAQKAKTVEKIVLFYDDHTFETFYPDEKEQ